MVDYGPGDEIVCIRETRSKVYRANHIYICSDIGPTKHPMRNRYRCSQCKTNMEEALGVWTTARPDLEACSCLFRKKLDFKKLCNVDETNKIKEDA